MLLISAFLSDIPKITAASEVFPGGGFPFLPVGAGKTGTFPLKFGGFLLKKHPDCAIFFVYGEGLRPPALKGKQSRLSGFYIDIL